MPYIKDINDNSLVIPLDEERSVLGRGPQATVQVPGEKIEPRHAVIWRGSDGRYHLKIHTSDIRAASDAAVMRLTDGGRIVLGTRTYTFHEGSPPIPSADPAQTAAPAKRDPSSMMSSSIMDVMSEYEHHKKEADSEKTVWYNSTPLWFGLIVVTIFGLMYLVITLLPDAKPTSPEEMAQRSAEWKELVGAIMDDMERNPDKYKDFKADGDPDKILKSLGMDPTKVREFVFDKAFGGGGGGGGSPSGGKGGGGGGGSGGMPSVEKKKGGNVSMTIKDDATGRAVASGGPDMMSSGGGGGGGVLQVSEGGQAEINFENTGKADQSKQVMEDVSVGSKEDKPKGGNLNGALPDVGGMEGSTLKVSDKNQTEGGGGGVKEMLPEEQHNTDDLEETLLEHLGDTEKEGDRTKAVSGDPPAKRRRGGDDFQVAEDPNVCNSRVLENVSTDTAPFVHVTQAGVFEVGVREGDETRSTVLWDGGSADGAGVADGGVSVPIGFEGQTAEVRSEDGASIWVAILDATGEQVDGFPVERVGGDLRHPRISPDGEGGVIVTWEKADEGKRVVEVFVRRFDALGRPAGKAERVAKLLTTNHAYPAAAARTDGAIALAWLEPGMPGKADIHARLMGGAAKWGCE